MDPPLTTHSICVCKGDGGFVVVKGSHKSNFPAPPEMINGDAYQEFLYQPEMKAGDAVFYWCDVEC